MVDLCVIIPTKQGAACFGEPTQHAQPFVLRGRIDDQQHFDRLAARFNLLRQFVSHHAADTKTPDDVGPFRADGAQRSQMRRGHFLDARRGRQRANVVWRQDIERLLPAQSAGELQAVESAAGEVAMQVEKRRARARIVDPQESGRIFNDFAGNLAGQMFDGRDW